MKEILKKPQQPLRREVLKGLQKWRLLIPNVLGYSHRFSGVDAEKCVRRRQAAQCF